jgi:hypothetical protein
MENKKVKKYRKRVESGEVNALEQVQWIQSPNFHDFTLLQIVSEMSGVSDSGQAVKQPTIFF